MAKFIERDDFIEIRNLAKKYGMSVADFGRSIARQAEGASWSRGRNVRLTEDEYEYIRSMAEANSMSIRSFCGLACRAFLKLGEDNVPIKYSSERGNARIKRAEAAFCNSDDEFAMLRIANKYEIPIASLIRYCATKFDGKNINL